MVDNGREHQLFLVEKLRRLNEELTGLMQVRPDILHEANTAMNDIVLLQQAITRNIPVEIPEQTQEKEDATDKAQ